MVFNHPCLYLYLIPQFILSLVNINVLWAVLSVWNIQLWIYSTDFTFIVMFVYILQHSCVTHNSLKFCNKLIKLDLKYAKLKFYNNFVLRLPSQQHYLIWKHYIWMFTECLKCQFFFNMLRIPFISYVGLCWNNIIKMNGNGIWLNNWILNLGLHSGIYPNSLFPQGFPTTCTLYCQKYCVTPFLWKGWLLVKSWSLWNPSHS